MDNEVLDNDILQINNTVPIQRIISVEKFVILSFLSFGIYPVWWIFKAWRYFKQLEKSDTMPFWRTFFSIIYLYNLFDKIQEYADQYGNEERYNSGTLFTGIIILNILNNLPFPYSFISLFSCIFFIKPFKVLNFAKENSPEVTCLRENFFSLRQYILILFGLFIWYLAISQET